VSGAPWGVLLIKPAIILLVVGCMFGFVIMGVSLTRPQVAICEHPNAWVPPDKTWTCVSQRQAKVAGLTVHECETPSGQIVCAVDPVPEQKP
jgi:hypothetical protein